MRVLSSYRRRACRSSAIEVEVRIPVASLASHVRREATCAVYVQQTSDCREIWLTLHAAAAHRSVVHAHTHAHTHVAHRHATSHVAHASHAHRATAVHASKTTTSHHVHAGHPTAIEAHCASHHRIETSLHRRVETRVGSAGVITRVAKPTCHPASILKIASAATVATSIVVASIRAGAVSADAPTGDRSVIVLLVIVLPAGAVLWVSLERIALRRGIMDAILLDVTGLIVTEAVNALLQRCCSLRRCQFNDGFTVRTSDEAALP